MEAGRSLLYSTPSTPSLPRGAHLRNPLSSTSVLMLHDQATRPIPFVPTTSIVRHSYPSLLSQTQTSSDRHFVGSGLSLREETENEEFDQYVKHLERQLLYQPGLWCPFKASCTDEKIYLAMSRESTFSDSDSIVSSELTIDKQDGLSSIKPGDVLTLAKRAMMASKEATLLAEKSGILESENLQSHFLSSDLSGSEQEAVISSGKVVRSKRIFERQSKKRKVSKKPDNIFPEVSRAEIADLKKKIEKGLNTDNPLRLFLSGPETRQLLTVKEEKNLFLNIQELMKLEKVKQRLQRQFNREPTLPEWAEAVGVSCQILQSRLHCGNRSREKMIYANFRLVVHIARQYEGKGLNIQDLLQEGSRGLMKSLVKFKPKAGCRFPSYAYWWIRQSIRKSIFQNSRTIRLPENVFGLLKKITDARRTCIQEGYLPTNQELAKRAGIRVEKLEDLLRTCRIPRSIQERAWVDQDVTFQEITADPEVEDPDLMIAKQMMRQHMRSFLRILSHREREIIEFRYGINGGGAGERKSLSEIGDIYGITKERVRQLESRALNKLKERLPSQGLHAYVNLLI